MPSSFSSTMRGVGYFLMSILFVGSGSTKMIDPVGIANGLKLTQFYRMAVANGIPLDEGDNLVLFVMALGLSMILSSLLFSFGVMRRVAALYLALCVVCFSVFVHMRWQNPMATDDNNQAHILKNLGVVGGLLVIAFAPPSAKEERAAARKLKRKME